MKVMMTLTITNDGEDNGNDAEDNKVAEDGIFDFLDNIDPEDINGKDKKTDDDEDEDCALNINLMMVAMILILIVIMIVIFVML